MKGYIPAEQRFSKIHFEKDPAGRKAKIQKYDNQVRKCLSAGRARSLPLLLEVGGTECEVLVVEGIEDPERAIVLRSVGDGAYHGWANAPLRTFDASRPLAPLHLDEGEIECAGTRALQVLGDRVSGKPLTADHDLLAFATRFKPKPAILDPEMGGIRPYQIDLLRKINNKVRVRANYLGGNVSHHGPEVLFDKSPGADYPITAFQPDGYVIGIKEGRVGRSDYWLKRYFHHLKARGWQIEPNLHTWDWGGYSPRQWPGIGYCPDDRMREIADSPDNPYDSDEGDEARPGVPAAAGEGSR